MRKTFVLLALALVLLGVGCRVDVVMDVKVDEGGGGEVVVGVGLDDAALARVGNLEQQLRTDDLTAAGWTVRGPEREGDVTWVRATKPFSDPAAAAAVISEVAGADGPFQGFQVERDEGLLGTTYRVTGTIDLTGGPAVFSDPDLAAALGGDPFGGTLDAILAEEGVTLDEVVDLRVRVELPGGGESVVEAAFAQPGPVELEVSSSQSSALARVGLWMLVVLLIGAAVIGALAFRGRSVRNRRGARYR